MSNDFVKAVEIQREHANKNLKAMNSFIVIKEGGDTEVFPNQPCYGKLERIGEGSLFVLDFLMKERAGWHLTKKVQKPFLDYLANRSPYKDVFIIKDVDYILKYGVMCNTDTPNNLMVGALVVVRSLWEYTYIPLTWKSLVDLGVGEDMALVAAHAISTDGKHFSVGQQGGGHRAFDGFSITEGIVRNFLKKNPRNAGKSYKDTGSYHRLHDLWSDTGRGSLLFGDYTGDVKKKSNVWGGSFVEATESSSLFPIANFLIEKEKKLMRGVEEEPKKRDLVKAAENYLIGLISVANGFPLGEVRRIRKALRELIAGGEEAGYRLPVFMEEHPGERVDFNRAFIWDDARKYNNIPLAGIHDLCIKRRLYE